MPYLGQQRIPFAKRSQTSEAAADSLQGEARTLKLAFLMSVYRNAGQNGRTDAEARRELSAAVGSDVPLSSICSLRGNLMEHGIVAPTGRERMGDFGKSVGVFAWVGNVENAE